MTRWPRKWHKMCHPAEEECGVYRVRLIDKGHRPVPICRFLGTDKSGILCIGRTSNMQKRRRQFVTGFKTFRGHSESMLLHLLSKYAPLERRYPKFDLEYQYVAVSSVRESERQEERLIKKYVKQYGEVPPLNSAIPKKKNLNSWRR